MISYLFEISFSWLIFYLMYAFFLQQERFFGINRIYLLTALIGGLCLPFLQIKTSAAYLPQLSILLDEITIGVNQNIDVSEQNPLWSFTNTILSIYCVGVVIGLLRLIYSLKKLYILYQEGIVEHKAFYYLIKTNTIHSPFSFGPYLFISNNISLEETSYQYIIEHEVTHIRQKHTLDLILIEFLGILFWFNPLVLLYKTALRDQHEFLADQAVLNHVPIKEYGQLLIEQSIPGLKIGLVNHLIYSQLKKRINMMTQKKQSKQKPYLRYALSFSAFLLVFWTVSCTKDLPKEIQEQISEQPLSDNNKTSTDINEEVFSIVEKMPRFPGCEDINGNEKDKKQCADQKLLKFIYDNIEYPKKAKEDGIEGMGIVRFIISKTGNINNIELLRAPSKECGEEILRVMQLMKDQHIVWSPGMQKGKTVNVAFNLPIRFKLQ